MKLITLFAAAIVTLAPAIASAAEDFNIRGRGTIVHVTDGDTFIVKAQSAQTVERLRQRAEADEQRYQRDLNTNDRFRLNEQTFVVRVGNIDTEESMHVDRSKNTAEGRYASSYAKKLLFQKEISFQCWEIGYYGRAICSVWNDEWEFGSHMISRGFSTYITKYGRHPFLHERYKAAEQ
jgi:endonuclease YncB( thermonuclease family)